MIMVMVRRVTLEDEQIHGGGPRVYRHVRFHQYSNLCFHMRKTSLDIRKLSGIKCQIWIFRDMQKVALRHAQMFLFAGSRMEKKK